MKRRIPATTEQHRAAAARFRAMKREVLMIAHDLGVYHNEPGTPSVTGRDADAIIALHKAIDRCVGTLNARMGADGEEPRSWDYWDTVNARFDDDGDARALQSMLGGRPAN